MMPKQEQSERSVRRLEGPFGVNKRHKRILSYSFGLFAGKRKRGEKLTGAACGYASYSLAPLLLENVCLFLFGASNSTQQQL